MALVDSKAAFEEFVVAVEPRLRRGFIATYGYDRGREATAEALAYAWEHWGRISRMQNPAGYLYRVGQTRTRRRRTPLVFVSHFSDDPVVEPGLVRALASLSERQRVAVFLVHGAKWTHSEVADLLGIKKPSVQKHVERGLAGLRQAMVTRER